MIERGHLCQVHNAARGTRFWIVRSEDEQLDPSVEHRPHAHGTRFESGVKNGARQPVIAQSKCTLSQDKNLRVGRRVALADGSVVRPCNQIAVTAHKDCPHRNLQPLSRSDRLFERKPHISIVGLQSDPPQCLATFVGESDGP